MKIQKKEVVPMTLEVYKKQVYDYLVKTYNVSTKEAKELMTTQESYWQLLLKNKLTPQETAYGMFLGLL